MNKSTITKFTLIFLLGSLSIFSITRKLNTNDTDDIYEINVVNNFIGTKSFDDTLEKTQTIIKDFAPYPKDLNMTKSLLAEVVGKEHIENGKFKYPSLYVNPYGRLGNTILQFFNSIYFAEVFNISTLYIKKGFCFVDSPITTSKGIKIIPVNEKPAEALSLRVELFDMYNGKYNGENRVYEFASETLKSIPKVKINNNGLYIHIRSGDIFSKKVCVYYGQPPLCFYESIIEKWGFKDIFILTEDRKNPVIDRLVQKYKAKLIITGLHSTLGFILNAKNLVISYGSFIPATLRLVPEDPEKRIFRYGNIFSYNRVLWKKYYYTDVSENYRRKLLVKNWHNTEEQREMMLNETCGDEWKISLYTKYLGE